MCILMWLFTLYNLCVHCCGRSHCTICVYLHCCVCSCCTNYVYTIDFVHIVQSMRTSLWLSILHNLCVLTLLCLFMLYKLCVHCWFCSYCTIYENIFVVVHIAQSMRTLLWLFTLCNLIVHCCGCSHCSTDNVLIKFATCSTLDALEYSYICLRWCNDN